MRQAEPQLTSLGVTVVMVTFDSGPGVDGYIRETGIAWPVLADRSRALYKAYGMARGRWWDIWGPATWAAYLKLLLRGRRLRTPTADVNQLGGDVLIDPEGIVRLCYVGNGPADRPAVSELIRIVSQSDTDSS